MQDHLMETAFTPIESLAGGVLIGLAAVCLMLLRGRILGATGILAGVLLPASRYDWTWRVMMLAGMFAGPWVYFVIAGQLPAINVTASTPVLAVGGVLVGIGVTLGSGCTSGHGVCGLARLSPRSFAATGTFMLTTGLTVYVIRHILGA
ncbi:YeeE/YedE domain protein [Roseobacter sp. GAI101]|nr:YeeE/YedE domain protein [Roseobacter sp. GAI101]